ncbi:MAG TPA: NUDIX hydrolase [Patescibacteria group bacterium]|nr:NUDIX hydrolase [Patescibacteria group bacterium]
MREIQRTIVVAFVFSKDGKLLMGKKDPSKGGVFPNTWHFPGGGINEDESFEQALAREVKEEAGLDIHGLRIVPIELKNYASSEKTLWSTQERVLCHMEFNYFEIFLEENADMIKLTPGDDLVELKWLTREELGHVEHIPGGREFLQKIGYI